MLYKNRMENFIEKYNVSRETYLILERYVALLCEWQKKFNLVSKNSLEFVWDRHIADSAQLFEYISDDIKNIYDFGSGAGFPALVLAIIAKEKRPDIKFKLIESISKKTVYLNAVKESLCLENVEIINDRIEKITLPQADMITARAMTSLDGLLKYSFLFSNKNTKMLFPKGKTFEDEVKTAKNNWNFNLIINKNKVCDDGVILLIENLRRKK